MAKLSRYRLEDPPPPPPKKQGWRRIAAWLWKVPSDLRQTPATNGPVPWDRAALIASVMLFGLSMLAFAGISLRWQIVVSGLVSVVSYFFIRLQDPAAALTRAFIVTAGMTVWAVLSWQFELNLLFGPILQGLGFPGAEGSLSLATGRLDGYSVTVLCVVLIGLIVAMLITKLRP